MSLLGYLSSGVFLFFFYIPYFFQGIRLRWMIRDQNCSYFRITTILLFIPLIFIIEFFTTDDISTLNVNHFTICAALLIFALVLYYTDIKKELSFELAVLYEAGVTFCAGYLISSNIIGSPLYVNMNNFLQICFDFASVLMLLSYFSSLDLSTPLKRKRSSFLYIMTGIMLVIISTWVFRIGIGFNLYGDCGTEGCEAVSMTTDTIGESDINGMESMGSMDSMEMNMRALDSMHNMGHMHMNSSSSELTMEQMEANAKIPFFIVQHFLFSIGILFPIWIFLKNNELLQEEEDLVSSFSSVRSQMKYSTIPQNDDL